ncbi:hypothetical protein Hanom_Chr11g00997931 [Helianthus anomalus]
MEPPPARKRRSEGLPPSDGKAPRPPCVEGLLSMVIERPFWRTDRTCASGRVAPCIAVMSATCRSRVLPQTCALSPARRFDLFLSLFSPVTGTVIAIVEKG